jgi:hypothetical protein
LARILVPGQDVVPGQDAGVNGPEGFVAMSTNSYTWANAVNHWNTFPLQVFVANVDQTSGDSPVTSSNATGLSYLGLMARRTGETGTALAVAAVTADSLGALMVPTANIISALVQPNNLSLDGTWLTYDPGGTDMFAVAHNGGHLFLEIMKNCRPGPVGCCVDATCTSTCGATSVEPCPVTTNNDSAITDLYNVAVPTVNVNPCTHHAVVPIVRASDKSLRLLFSSALGGILITNPLVTNVFHFQNPTMSGVCNGEDAGVRVCFDGTHWCAADACTSSTHPAFRKKVQKLHVATTAVSNKCYAVVSWDETLSSSVEGLFRSRLKIFDITTETLNPTTVFSATIGDASTYNAYMPVVAASGSSVAMAFYVDDPVLAGCSVDVEVVTADITTLGSLPPSRISSGTFPQMKFSGSDYITSIPTTATPGGGFLFGWDEAVCRTGGACLACAVGSSCPGGNFGNAYIGASVIP